MTTRDELIEAMLMAKFHEEKIACEDAGGFGAEWKDVLRDFYHEPIVKIERRTMKSALSAINALGLAVVPRAATDAMFDAGLECDTWAPIEIYNAMLAEGEIK